MISGELKLAYLKTEEIANLLTKPLVGNFFETLTDAFLGAMHHGEGVGKAEKLKTLKN